MLIILLIIPSIVLSFTTATFLSRGNIEAIFLGAAIDVILVAGQVIVIIGGGFDLSIGSEMALTAVTIGLLLSDGIAWWIALLCGILVGICCGIVNGVLVARLGVNPLIATLGMLFVFQGIALVITNSATEFAAGNPLVSAIGQGSLFGVPMPIWIALVIAVAFAAFLRWGKLGREWYLVGGNAEAARLVGVHVRRVRAVSYILMGALAGVAGALTLGRFGTANADTGQNVELNVIAAAVIGGASLLGGEGSVVGGVLGVLLIGLIDDAVVVLNVSVFWQQLLVGLVLVAAVAANLGSSAIRSRMSQKRAISPATKDGVALLTDSSIDIPEQDGKVFEVAKGRKEH